MTRPFLKRDDLHYGVVSSLEKPTAQQLQVWGNAVDRPDDLEESVFPALDILRLSVKHSGGNEDFCSEGGGAHSPLNPNRKPANQLLAPRTFCTCWLGRTCTLDVPEGITGVRTDLKPGTSEGIPTALAAGAPNLLVVFMKSGTRTGELSARQEPAQAVKLGRTRGHVQTSCSS